MYWKNGDTKLKILGTTLEPNEVLDLTKWKGTSSLLVLHRMARMGVGTLVEEAPEGPTRTLEHETKPSPVEPEPVVAELTEKPAKAKTKVEKKKPKKKTSRKRAKKSD